MESCALSSNVFACLTNNDWFYPDLDEEEYDEDAAPGDEEEEEGEEEEEENEEEEEEDLSGDVRFALSNVTFHIFIINFVTDLPRKL